MSRRSVRGASRFVVGALAAALTGSVAQGAHAEPPAPIEAAAPAEETAVMRQESRRGFVFQPSRPALHAFRFALGAFYDAIDPEVMYGYILRIPQITADARYGLGAGWSFKGHLNSMGVTTELLLGGAYAWKAGRWSFEAAASAGVYVGTLNQLAFDVLLLAPEYRPELTIGYDFGGIALSLRGSLLLMGPERIDVGGVWGGLDNASFFAGHGEMLYVENTTRSDSVWYFGLGAMTTRSYYQLWLLFPDSPSLYTYPRIVAGYEF